MIILGIDPGTANTGYGIIKNLRAKKRGGKESFKFLDCGVIKTFPTSSAPERLKQINTALGRIIKNHRPKFLVMESLYFFKNLKTAIPVSQAGGVIMFTAAKNNLPVYQFTPLQVKLAVTGFGRAEKEIVQKRTKALLKVKELPKSDDAVDALAVALTFCLIRRRG